MKYNWLTACRSFEYVIGQNIYKLAQSYIDYIVVIPGAAGAFRTETFKKYITFDHDTITEDLDFTYCFHKNRLQMSYDRKMIVHTQDPMTLSAYANQLRRWYAGGWQNLIKHRSVIYHRFNSAMELSLVYTECVIFALVIFLLPFISLSSFLLFLVSYFILASILCLYAGIKERRWDMIFVPFTYFFIMYVNSYLFLEQMVKELFLRKKNLYWFTPERTNV
jgi:cellulose synthase/poly-beta-1,6-N-acetylglucosamine synthase-like glycosyltransferase